MRCPSCGNLNRAEARFCDACGSELPPASGATEDLAAPAGAREPAARSPELTEDAPRLIAERYEVVGYLGRGGRKRVYKARDREAAGAGVAVAVFGTEGVAETAVARARREAQAMARLGRHPHIVSVLDTGEHEGAPFLVSELMSGGEVGSLLATAPAGRLAADQAIAIAIDVCRALEHAHGCGIVHRDLKPANIWIDENGRARLGDFGLATTERRSREAAGLIGTVAYLPPEQALGRTVDERADLYSLGAVIYELVTGQPPFPGDDAVGIIGRHVNAEPVPARRLVPEVPPGLDRLIARLLEKSPDERPENAAAVLASLERIAADPDAGAEERSEADPLEELGGGALVGRGRELQQVREAVDEAIAGHGNMLFLVGEPGIGKTRTAEELSTVATVRGARVLWGRCHEGERAPAFWPWIEAIREFVREADPVGLRWQLGARAPDLARLVPEIAARLGDEPSGPIDGGEDHFRLFDAVTGFLADASRSRPLVIVLDDLHWADASSLELLRYISRQLSGTGLMLVGTYRDVELGRHHPLAGALAELTASDRSRRIQLRGLDASGVAAMIDAATGATPPDPLAREVWERTEGNPFFVGEIVRLLASEGALELSSGAPLAVIPQGVRDVVGRRLDRLRDSTNEVLRVAAVVGREFEPEVVEAAAGLSAGEVAGALAEAIEARLVADSATSPNWLAFTHAIVRETLYAEIGAAERTRLHRRIGEATESLHADELDPYLDGLARHFAEAAPSGQTTKAVEYARRAAERATRQLAHEDAARHYARALDLVEAANDPDLRMRLGLAHGLGRALTVAGRLADAREVLDRAAQLARELGDSRELATVALGIAAVAVVGSVDEPLLALLREALDGIDEDDGVLRVELMSAVATRLVWRDPQGEAARCGREALDEARDLRDDHAIAVALTAQQQLLFARPEASRERLLNADELIEVAERAGDRELAVRGHSYRVAALLDLADVTAADAAMDDYASLAETLRRPQDLWRVALYHALRATMEGRFADAVRLSNEARRGGERAQEPLADQLHALQMSVIRRHLGQVEEALPAIREMTMRYPAIPAWRLTLASFLAELGSHDEARAEFDRLAANEFEDVPRDIGWLPGMTRLADASFWLGDRERAAVLHRKLEPFAGLAVIIGGASCQGPVDLYLGRLAFTAGRPGDAVARLESAVAGGQLLGDRPSVLEARYTLGRALVARGRVGDRERGIEELRAALDGADAFGMRRLVDRALAARLEAQGLADVDVLTSIEAVVEAVGSELPDLSALATGEGAVTILFSDIENSTLINERLGDERWLEILRRHNTVFRSRLAEYGGYEVKSQGDGFMLAFAEPSAALAFAIAVQTDFAATETAAEQRVSVRMGLHAGEAIAEDGDLFGRSVVLAARIAAQAVGGEILVSEELQRTCADGEADDGRYRFDAGRELELKGLAGTHRVFRVERVSAAVA
jgi:predicted ATPase